MQSVCVCVVGACSHSVIVPKEESVRVPVWPFSHANQPVFSGVCCLNQRLHGVRACKRVCDHPFIYMRAWNVL